MPVSIDSVKGGPKMKKPYNKPDIQFESFALSESIAAGCEERPHNATHDCGVKFGKQEVFTTPITGCTTKVVDGDYNGLCYHNPSSGYNVFMS
jgi:hypothetical protein